MKISRNALLQFSHQDKHARNRIQINFESVVYPIFRIAIFLLFFFIPLFHFFACVRREAIKITWPWVKRHAAEFRFEADLIRLAAITNAVIANSDWEREHPLVPVRYFLIVRLINEQKIAAVYGEKGRSGGLCAWPRFSRSKIDPGRNSIPRLACPIIGTICRSENCFSIKCFASDT